jgi:uncharacterized Zn finger protein (UPF0148 family)
LTRRFDCPDCGLVLVPEIEDGFLFCPRCALEIDAHFYDRN